MPTVSVFFGIMVRMYREIGGKHNVPHVHAKYAGHEVVVDFKGNVLEGSIPVPKMKLLVAWIEIHKEDLRANWEMLSQGEETFKIDPLR